MKAFGIRFLDESLGDILARLYGGGGISGILCHIKYHLQRNNNRKQFGQSPFYHQELRLICSCKGLQRSPSM